ncbi:hypothetical protein EG240_01625 [Paenimyroides tangerinum]|uniref:Uncharacterized protein n=1 Tax=Paenimyroides tangerinum TaxID=2488728 RepID=A0A3P3WJ13_9FLAO|nr:hypothetical protein [Paenimyroides tangerinum]RRJ92743.1 hypothetical protein EG240_01625 [Paenimyroides tangerinum]
MKIKLLLLLVTICFAEQSWGQDITSIRLDFKNKCFYPEDIKALEKLKKGDFYQLKIIDVNMNLYKIVFDKRDTIITSNVEFPTFDLVNIEGIGDLLGKINFSTNSVSNLVDAFNASAKGNHSIMLMEWAKSNDRNLAKEKTIEDIKSLIDVHKDNLILKDGLLKSYKMEVDELQFTIQKKLHSYSVLDKSNSTYQLLSGNINFDSILVQTQRWRANIKSNSNAIIKQQSEYLKIVSVDNIKKIIENDTELKEADKTLKEAFTKAISNTDKLYESVNSEKVASWITELVYKDNNSTFSYTTLPQQLNGDQTKLNIQLIRIKEDSDLPNYQTEIQFPQKRQFYVGLGMSFYYAGFRNEAYSVKSTVSNEENTEYNIVDEKNRKGELGLATLIHFGWRPFYDKRTGDWFAVNLVTGPALSFTNTVKPRVAVGGGFAFGYKNMLTINGLYMGGFEDRKSETYNADAVYSSKPENVTVSKLAGSFAISLGYIYKF